TNPDATPFSRMTLADLQTIVGPPEHKGAGPNVVIDPIGVQVAIDNTLPLSLLNGKETERIENCLLGKQYIGTTIEVE
ncbi:MAG: hypothetical protein H8D82_00190, partial [Euryarchaeota archaeon]|nr:hypothetical protein [Euryarchaeota archaeon]